MTFRSHVTPAVWDDLTARGQTRRYRPNSVLLRQGESPTSVIVLSEGTVRVIRADEQGNATTLMLRGPGEVLGEMGVLCDRPRSATVVTVTACVGHAMAATAFRGFLDRYSLRQTAYALAADRLEQRDDSPPRPPCRRCSGWRGSSLDWRTRSAGVTPGLWSSSWGCLARSSGRW